MNTIHFSKILIVDDSSFFRFALKRIFKDVNIGKIFREAKDGKDAVTQYITHRLHLVIMDIVIPNVGGVKATQAIIKYHSNAKIIVISSRENKETVDDAIRSGAKDYVLKPFDAGQVVMAVSKQLSGNKI